jgi:hypothetical protein
MLRKPVGWLTGSIARHYNHLQIQQAVPRRVHNVGLSVKIDLEMDPFLGAVRWGADSYAPPLNNHGQGRVLQW